ncbi:hypothetical protein quinque_014577 [Culex quinquefasciatus]
MKFPAEEVPSRRFHLVEDGEDKYAALGKANREHMHHEIDRLLKRSEQTLVNILLANNCHQPDLSEVFFWWPRAST